MNTLGSSHLGMFSHWAWVDSRVGRHTGSFQWCFYTHVGKYLCFDIRQYLFRKKTECIVTPNVCRINSRAINTSDWHKIHFLLVLHSCLELLFIKYAFSDININFVTICTILCYNVQTHHTCTYIYIYWNLNFVFFLLLLNCIKMIGVTDLYKILNHQRTNLVLE